MPGENNKNLSILIVDDDTIEQVIISQLMKPFAHHIDKGPNPYEYEERIKQENYDIVFIDVNLIDLNGIEFVKQFRKNNPFNSTFFVVITSNENQRILALEVGANDFLLKPLRQIDITGIKEKHLFHKSKLKKETLKTLSTQTSILQNPLPFDDELLAKVLPKFLTTFIEKMDMISRGISENDLDLVHEASHGLKGCLGYFLNEEAMTHVIALEQQSKKNNLLACKGLTKDLDSIVNSLVCTLKEKGVQRGA